MSTASLDQQFAEVLGQLVNFDEMDAPSIEAKIHDLPAQCQKASEVLNRLEESVLRSVNE